MDSQTPVHRPWTLMIYMAGDNGKIFDTKTGRIKLMASMEEAGYQDLFEMGMVGTTDQCAVTCLFDTLDASYLVEVRKGKRFSDSLVQPLREVNMGDPNTLKEFIVRSVQNYPADRYALVIWNHGTGWLDVDHYATVRALEDENRTNGAIFARPTRRSPRARRRGPSRSTTPARTFWTRRICARRSARPRKRPGAGWTSSAWMPV